MNLILILTALSFTLSGCGDKFSTGVLGDLFGKKIVKKSLDSSQFRAECELNMDDFAKIMDENINSTIKCLGENLHLFINIVESGKPGYLSRVALEQFIIRNRPDIKPEMVKALKAVFDLNFLITGEDPNFISKQSVDKIIDLASVFNTQASLNFSPTYRSTNRIKFDLHQIHREKVSSANKTVVMTLRRIFNPNRGGQIDTLNILKLLEAFTTKENQAAIDKVKKLLFVKKVLFGGEKDVITHQELERLILNFDHLALIALDLVKYKYIEDLNQKSILELLKKDVSDLSDIVLQWSSEDTEREILFTIEEAMDAAKLFMDGTEIDQFTNLIKEAKKVVMGGNDQEVSRSEIGTLFTHGKNLLNTGSIFHRIYEKFLGQLESPKPVDIDFDDYRNTYPEHQKELDEFERIVKNYRFMKGEFLSGYYSTPYHRNADGMFQIAAFEYVLKLAFKAYGSPSTGLGGFSLDPKEVLKVVKKFEKELIALDIILPQRAIGIADNVSLLGSLFQNQSDENKVLDVNEGTEFAISLFTSLDVAKDLMSHYKAKKCEIDKFNRVEPGCFRENFFLGVCKSYGAYYPRLLQSLGVEVPTPWDPKVCDKLEHTEANDAFLDTSIMAARTCMNYTDGEKEEIWYSQGDIFSIFMALMHVETTIIRWDTNLNNFMDANEVMEAYRIYSPALDGFLEDKPWYVKKFKKQIYQFMIKYEEVPDEKNFGSIMKFAGFLFSSKSAPANRKTLAAILHQISLQNAKLVDPKEPKFDCNWMRDMKIPTGDDVPAASHPIEEQGTDFSFLLRPYLYLAD